MKKNLLLPLILAAGFFATTGHAQTNPIESDANLKNTTTHVVVERQVIETTKTYQQDTPRDIQRKIAIIVENRAAAGLNDKVAVLEDLVSSRVAGKGLSVISRDVVTRSLKNYATGNNPNGELNAVDQALENGTTALNLAQTLGADYILVPAITSLGAETKTYNGNGIATVNVTHRLRVTYKIVDAGTGGAVRGDTVIAEKTTRQTANVQTEDTDVLNDLLDDAAQQLADTIVQSAGTLAATTAKADQVTFQVSCTLADPQNQPVTIPPLYLTTDNTVVLTNLPVPVQALDVNVELDGVVLGSAPGEFKARPGLHKIRLTREGTGTWERTINVSEGQTLRVALQLTPDSYARWTATTSFLADLVNGKKLTDAQVKVYEGLAKFLSESHYRVDTKENLQFHKSLL